MIQFDTLDGITYAENRFSMLKISEGAIVAPNVPPDNNPTIGVGFNLRSTPVFNAVISVIAPKITATQKQQLIDIINKTWTHATETQLQDELNAKMSSFGTTRSTFTFTDEAEMKVVFDKISPIYDQKVDAWLAGIPESHERLALFSLAYNQKDTNPLLGPSLQSAIVNGNRANAWYEIRYNSNGDKLLGIASRRYRESEEFGLYKDHATQIATSQEAHQAATMYAIHRDAILAYEKKYVPLGEDVYAEMQPAIAELKIEYKIPTNFAIEEVQQASAAFQVNLNGDGTTFDNLTNDQDLLIGSAVANTLNGGQGNDVLIGLGGDDILIGGVGNDIISGGAGFDTLQYQASVVLLNVDIRERTALAVPAPLPNESDVIIGVERIIATDQKDTITLSLQPTTAVKEIILGDGDDNLNLFAISTAGAETFVTTGLTINMGKGNDTVRTYSGDDTYLFTQGDGIDIIEDRHGLNDTLKLTGTALTSANAIFTRPSPLSADLTNTILNFVGVADQITFKFNFALTDPTSGLGVEKVVFSDGVSFGIKEIRANALLHAATAGNDTITGFDNSDDLMFGGAGNDVLQALSGNDVLNGGTGADTMEGDAGIDTATYQDSAAAVTVNLSLTTAQVGGTGESLGDVLLNIENVTGSAFADTLTGSAGNNVIEGGAGADKINGGAGVDTASYRASAAAVTVSLALTTAQVSSGDASGDVLSAVENLTGSAFADTLTGGTGNNIIEGGVGADKITGGAGIDTASYSTSTAGVTVKLALTTAQVSGGDASGDVLSGIENLTGSGFADTLTGSAGANVINGGLGSDTVTGGAGADVFVIGKDAGASDIISDFSTATVGEKISLVGFVGSTLFADLAISQVGADTVVALESGQSLTLKNVVASSLTAASFGQILGGIDGTAGNDILNGTANADVMHGLAGNDILNGSAGADTMDGGVGIDTAAYAASAVAVTVDLTLATGQTGGDAAGDILLGIENVTGSAFNDVLTGNAFANLLSGGGASDKLTGGLGADTLDGGLGADVASYASSAAGVTVDLNIATAQVSGGDASGDVLLGIENLTGSAFNDTFILSSAANFVDGGSGGNDTVSYAKSAAVQVDLSVFFQIGGDAIGDILTGIENVTGSAFADSLTGDFNANILTGGSGKDTLTGGLGADIFKYSAITDSGAVAGARDIIKDFTSAQADKVDLSVFTGDFVFKGTGAFTGTAHEINYAQVAGNTVIGIDADGNGILDFQIEMSGLHTLAASDFLL